MITHIIKPSKRNFTYPCIPLVNVFQQLRFSKAPIHLRFNVNREKGINFSHVIPASVVFVE